MSKKDTLREHIKPDRHSSYSRCFHILWRSCNLCMSVFFALAAYVQINDPDAAIWMAAYAIPAGLCFWVSLKPMITETLIWRKLCDLHMFLCATVAVILGWSLYNSTTKNIIHEEEGRECFGLVLIAVWLLLCRHSEKSGVGGLRLLTAVAVTIFPFVAWLYYYINKELRSSWPLHCKTAL
ncbi:transmembrane protein 220-like [Acipenser oxyrinchus oxyrinchus]|uniref:Transmembrane protein 220-like n=1 Tax=Acipenser oxyrinchus oxyrinchus TaxID=40147 RepID=A0AAD8G5M1_ACIOX|nr:transmembrane protein 220-like [Acipenser oxyrinchus oxyrinchus]